MKKILLASSSPRRTMLLNQIGIDHEVWSPDVDERVKMAESPEDLVVSLAVDKALNVADKARDGLVIGADTVVLSDGQIFGKPNDESEALAMLTRLQGTVHQVYSGVAIVDAQTRGIKAGFRKVDVEMVPCKEEWLRAYIATGEPMDKAGAYSIQGKGAMLIKAIHGDFYAVMGLPIVLTVDLLSQYGVDSPLFFL